MERKLAVSDLKILLNALDEIPSKTGRANYKSIRVRNNTVILKRESSGNEISISINELFDVYENESFINTIIVRNYITGYVNSPACAVLMGVGLYDKNGYRINDVDLDNVSKKKSVSFVLAEYENTKPANTQSIKDESDEQRFFRLLSEVIGIDYIQSKGIGNPVDKELIELYSDYRKLSFNGKVEQILKRIAEQLESDFNFGDTNLASKIDGLIVDHPIVGTRIVEFDEEQHFTPPRLITLTIQQENFDFPYFAEYINICKDTSYLNSEVIPKHRIKLNLSAIPTNIKDFQERLSKQTKTNGYIEAKNGFPYLGGRISQRAYYDTLRDVAHLAEENNHLKVTLRFAKRSFENEFHRKFQHISDIDITSSIKKRLWTCFDIKIT